MIIRDCPTWVCEPLDSHQRRTPSSHVDGGWPCPGGAPADAVLSRVGMVISEYLLVFVLVAQLFAKLPVLAALPPSVQKPLFAMAQLVVLVLFVVEAFRLVRRSRGYRHG